MENGRTEQIIDKLVDMIENGQSVPLSTGKVMVNRDEAVLMLRELENIVKGELKIYREVNDRKGKIINEAKQEAEDIIYEAEKTASRIRVTKRMPAMSMPFRMDELTKDEQNALRTANDIYAASVIYTDEMLTEVNDVIAQAYDLIHAQYARMVESLEEKARLVAENKAELMNSLKELSKEDRYAQILELGQLLSNELYNERQKIREAANAEEISSTADMTYGTEMPDVMREPDTTDISRTAETTDIQTADIPVSAHTDNATDIAAVPFTNRTTDTAAGVYTGKTDDIITDTDITEITATHTNTEQKMEPPTDTLATIPMDYLGL